MRPFLLALLFICPSVFAYPIAKYIGFGTGYTWTESTFNEQVVDFGGIETPSYSEVKNSSNPFSFYGGFRFHPNYGLEIGYLNYGSIDFVKTLTKIASVNDPTLLETKVRDATIETSGYLINHVFYYQIFSKLTLQGKAGVLFGTNQYSDVETYQNFGDEADPNPSLSANSSTDSFAKFQFAAAALYQYDPDWLIRLQLNQIEFEHDDENESFTQWFTQLSFEYQL